MTDVSYKGSCHCGKVTFNQRVQPKCLVDCNCSICSKLGTLWAHSEIGDVELIGADHTIAYVWGDRLLSFHSCRTCGCTTHWMSLNSDESSRMAVNFRLCRAADRANLQIKKFDGAESWEYLD